MMAQKQTRPCGWVCLILYFSIPFFTRSLDEPYGCLSRAVIKRCEHSIDSLFIRSIFAIPKAFS